MSVYSYRFFMKINYLTHKLNMVTFKMMFINIFGSFILLLLLFLVFQRAQTQHDKLSKMIEDLEDSESKLTKLLEDYRGIEEVILKIKIYS